jgi:hypothetical protein
MVAIVLLASIITGLKISLVDMYASGSDSG